MATDPDAERWLPLAEAVAHLGLSRHQLRRRVRAGQIASRQAATPHGPAYEVRVDLDATVASAARHPDGRHADGRATVTPPLTELVALVRDLQADVVAKAEAAAMWQERAELLGIQLQQAQDRIRMLEAPKAPTWPEIAPERTTAVRPAETAQRPTPTQRSTPTKRAWWLRWLPA